jgi:hypothetical protein
MIKYLSLLTLCIAPIYAVNQAANPIACETVRSGLSLDIELLAQDMKEAIRGFNNEPGAAPLILVKLETMDNVARKLITCLTTLLQHGNLEKAGITKEQLHNFNAVFDCFHVKYCIFEELRPWQELSAELANSDIFIN